MSIYYCLDSLDLIIILLAEKGQVQGARPRVSKTLQILTMNTWGLGPSSEEKETRMPAIASFLKLFPHDIVFIQEAWYHADFLLLKDTSPYSTFYGSPGSRLCPAVENNKTSYKQGLLLDCHGLMILSQHKILGTEHIFFKDRIPKFKEKFVRRGAIAARIEVTEVVGGKKKTIKISAINTHLATWYSEKGKEEEDEKLWTSVREKQADEVIALVASHKKKSDVVVVAGDLNSTPGSAVYKKFISAGLTDTLVNSKGKESGNLKYNTYGHASNTWTKGQYPNRIDYILYTDSSNIKVKTSAYKTINAKTEKDGKEISMADHSWVEANLNLLEK